MILRAILPWALTACVAAQAPKVVSPLPVDLAFTGRDGGTYVLRAGTTKPELWRRAKDAGHPSLSPDGTRLAITWSRPSATERSGSRFIALLEGPGREPRVIFGTPNHHVYGSQWSPDGTRLLFHRLKENWGTSVVNADGSGAQDLLFRPEGTPPANSDASPAFWAPDMKSIYVWDFQALIQLDPEGRILRSLPFTDFGIEMTSSSSTFQIHPEGRRVLVDVDLEVPDLRSEYPTSVIMLVDLDTRQARRISPKGLQARTPCWLPDGRSFLYTGFGKPGHGLFWFNLETGENRLVVRHGVDPSVAPPQR